MRRFCAEWLLAFVSKSSFVTESFDSYIACRRGGNSHFSFFTPISLSSQLFWAISPSSLFCFFHLAQVVAQYLCKAKPLFPETLIFWISSHVPSRSTFWKMAQFHVLLLTLEGLSREIQLRCLRHNKFCHEDFIITITFSLCRTLHYSVLIVNVIHGFVERGNCY